jgi:hypothetical protein
MPFPKDGRSPVLAEIIDSPQVRSRLEAHVCSIRSAFKLAPRAAVEKYIFFCIDGVDNPQIKSQPALKVPGVSEYLHAGRHRIPFDTEFSFVRCCPTDVGN